MRSTPGCAYCGAEGSVTPTPAKLVLCVIDAMAPTMLERAVAQGAAPMLGELMQRGRYVPDCVAAFPSVTPVCAASIVTGVAQDRHRIPAMNWFHREEDRYVEYGSSFRAAQRFGIARQLTDTIYNMNRAHLSSETPTVFETLDDAQVRTAGTTYLMYRGRHRHEPQRDTALTRIASTLVRHPVMGPRELFYADIFASRRTGCRSGLGMPGMRDRHSGCVSAYLVEHDLFDFLLLSLPDNDWYSHKYGPDAQVQSIAQADHQLARVFQASGGIEEFLAEHALIVMADHSQAPVAHTIALQEELSALGVRGPSGSSSWAGGEEPRIAVCPSQRAAMVYALHESERDAMRASVVTRALTIEGVEHVMWLARDAHDVPSEGIVSSPVHGELRFRPGGEVEDERRCPLERRRAAWPSSMGSSRTAACAPPPIQTPSPACGRRSCARLRARSCCRPHPDTSSSTGVARRTSEAAAMARFTPATRSARSCCAGSRLPSASRPSGRSRDVAPLVRSHFGCAEE